MLNPINWNSLIEFDYENDLIKDKLSVRVHGIYYSDEEGWILRGFCFKTGYLETFILNNIKNVKILK